MLLHSFTSRLSPQRSDEDKGTLKVSRRLTRPRSFVEFFDKNPPPHSAPFAAPSIEYRRGSSMEDVEQGQRKTSLGTETVSTTLLLPPTVSLPLLVMIDMFSVSLVVPLLFQYYKTAGVTSASQRELLSSVFSSSQIVGGLLLGALADAGWVRRRTILFVSFAGSALSYALIVYGGLRALVFSRVLVGVVKQTMTISTTMLTHYTTREDRARHMGRLNASSTVAWIFGPSFGALLYKNIDHRAPAILACALFVLNIGLAAVLLPRDEGHEAETKKPPQKTLTSFTSNLRSCFSSKVLGSVVASLLIFTWVTRATSYASMASYYEEMYGMETHQRGYLSSYQQSLMFVVQSALVGPLLKFLGGERQAIFFAALLLCGATFLELQRSLPFFLAVLCPAISLSLALLNLSLRSLVTHVAPKESLGSVLAALDVLENATAVSVPFYRTMVFAFLGSQNEDAAMKGDPDPMAWITSAGFHWLGAAFAMGYLLLSPDRQEQKKKT